MDFGIKDSESVKKKILASWNFRFFDCLLCNLKIMYVASKKSVELIYINSLFFYNFAFLYFSIYAKQFGFLGT